MFNKSLIAVFLFGLVATCFSSVIVDDHVHQDNLVFKRSVITDLIPGLPGSAQVCSYVIKFAYTLGKKPMSMLVNYLKTKLGSIAKRDVTNAKFTRDRRGITDILTKILSERSTEMACKYIVKFVKVYAKISLLSTCFTAVVINKQEHVLVKRGIIENMITAGDGSVCKLIIAFSFTMAKYQMGQLVQYLQANMAGAMGKRDVNEVDFIRNRRDVSTIFESLVNSSRGVSCKLIVSFLKLGAHYQFERLVSYITSNIGTIIG